MDNLIPPGADDASIQYAYDNQRFNDDEFLANSIQPKPDSNSCVPCEALGATEISSPSSSQQVIKDKSFWGRCRRKAWILPIIHTQFWFSANFSLMAPYFPPLAAAKGIAPWRYGFVFSTLKITMLLGSVFAERLMVHVSPPKVYLTGQGGFSTFMIVLGLLYWSPGGNTFLGLGILAAVFGGFVSAMYSVSMYSIVTERFAANTGIIIASMECIWGLGNMVGSILGGVLIDAWAYPLPFFVIGAILMLSFPVIAKRGPIPERHRRVVKDDPSSVAEVRYYKAFCDPLFLIDMVTVMLSWVIMAFNEPTLEPYIRQFHLSSTEVGTIFTVQFASYCFGALSSGFLCNLNMEECFAFVGQTLTALAYLILGPAPFIPVGPALWMIYLSQVFTGIGMAAQFVCGYSHALKRLLKKGYPDNIRTSGFVSSAVFTFLVFGAITTPPIAGYLVETLGYRMGSMPLFALLVLWSGVTFVVWLQSVCGSPRPGSRGSMSLHHTQ